MQLRLLSESALVSRTAALCTYIVILGTGLDRTLTRSLVACRICSHSPVQAYEFGPTDGDRSHDARALVRVYAPRGCRYEFGLANSNDY